jgi:cellulose synthase/poly-beta-1,6-N-acetylglucosamine synthase-like glycosyltransferase
VPGSSVTDVTANPANTNARGISKAAEFLITEKNVAKSTPSVLATILERRQKARHVKSTIYARLSSLGVNHEEFISAVDRSKQSGASVIVELIANGIVSADDYYRKVAEDLDLQFSTSINPSTIESDTNADFMEKGDVLQVFARGAGTTLLHVAPDFRAEEAIQELIDRDTDQIRRIRICTPKTILTALQEKKSQSRLFWATSNLYQKFPELSAKQVLAPWQAYLLGLVCALFPVCIYFYFLVTLTVVHVFASALFTVVIFMRLAALRALRKSKVQDTKPSTLQSPKYSVLVALHKEAPVVSQLVRAMSRLDWPASRLEVFYVCEADDNETIEALSAQGFPNHHRIIKVPASLPRTKPKALNFALKACSGDYVVIYDAEDRPHPQQLKEAWSVFSKSEESLACLQAPLVVTNARSSWLSKMFAFEYAAHFKGLLPYLAQAGVPLPLGGTSNHFRKSALEAVGGWDPHNVTEDADLGIRFYRFGYKCGVLQLATLEDGPETLREWVPQRTRWQKGWMQTFLVQNRNVSQLFKILGSRNALYFEALLAGFILSPLLYAVSILMAAYSIYAFDLGHMVLTAMNLMLYAMGYFCAIAMGLECANKMPMKDKIMIALSLPAYWLLLSVAAWRAVYQLMIKPHHWEKTPHRPSALNLVSDDHCS